MYFEPMVLIDLTLWPVHGCVTPECNPQDKILFWPLKYLIIVKQPRANFFLRHPIVIGEFKTCVCRMGIKMQVNRNKNGVLWSQTCMRIEMRLRCFFGYLVIGNWQFVIGNIDMDSYGFVWLDIVWYGTIFLKRNSAEWKISSLTPQSWSFHVNSTVFRLTDIC